MKTETTCLGRRLWAEVRRLDSGLDIGLYGGDSSHVGAVTLAEGDWCRTLQRPEHRDGVLSEQWARHFAALTGGPVCVRCGVHFDHFSKSDLAAVLRASDTLLQMTERMIGW